VPPGKQRFNVYTMMLIVSFIALVLGSLMLYTELNKYGPFPQWRTTEAGSTPTGS
jgi:hypothetical protein